MGADGKWVDRDAGPVVRPYAVTGGRTEPADGEVLDLIAIVVDGGRPARGRLTASGFSPEHRRIVSLCRRPATVADVASDTALPLGVVRVLLADLIQQGGSRCCRGGPPASSPAPICSGRYCMDSAPSERRHSSLAVFKILVAGGFGAGQDHAGRRRSARSGRCAPRRT